MVRIEASYQLDLIEVIVDSIDHSADEGSQRSAGSGKCCRTAKLIRWDLRRAQYTSSSLDEGTLIFVACRYAAICYGQIRIDYNRTGVIEIVQGGNEIADPAFPVIDVWRPSMDAIDNIVNSGLDIVPALHFWCRRTEGERCCLPGKEEAGNQNRYGKDADGWYGTKHEW